MKPEDVTALMTVAEAAWNNRAPWKRKVIFTWRSKQYRVTENALRLEVFTPAGKPVACRYH